MKELERYYQILELQPGSTLEEINQAYKIWYLHGILIASLIIISAYKKAQQKLQDINEARNKLRLYKLKYGQYFTPNREDTNHFLLYKKSTILLLVLRQNHIKKI